MIMIRENRSVRRKSVPLALCSSQIPNEMDWLDHGLSCFSAIRPATCLSHGKVLYSFLILAHESMVNTSIGNFVCGERARIVTEQNFGRVLEPTRTLWAKKEYVCPALPRIS